MSRRTVRSGFRVALFAVCVGLAGCILTPAGTQLLELQLALSRSLAAGEAVLAHEQFFPAKVSLKKHFVRVSGRIDADVPPDRVDVLIAAEDEDGKIYHRFKLSVKISPDGTFSATGRWKKNLVAGTKQSFFLTPVGADLVEGTNVELCAHVTKKKATLAQQAECGLQGTFALPAALDFDQPGFHELITVRGVFPGDLEPTSGRRLVVALRDASRPDVSCDSDHPLSGCATVDWDDFDGRRNVPPGGGYFENRLVVQTDAGEVELFLNMNNALGRELDDDFALA